MKQKTTYKRSQLLAILSYVFKRLFRLSGKTLILLALATLLVGAVGFLAMAISQYEELYKTVPVRSTATGFSSRAIEMMAQSYLGDIVYYEGRISVVVATDEIPYPYPLIITGDIERYLDSVGQADAFSIKSDLDTSSIKPFGDAPVIFVGKIVADWTYIGQGDSLSLLGSEGMEALAYLYQDEDYLEFIALYGEPHEQTLEEAVAFNSVSFKVIGIVESEGDEISMCFFAPLHRAINQINGLISAYGDEGVPVILEYSEFQVADNSRIDEYQALLRDMASQSVQDGSVGAEHFTDTARIDSIKRVLEMLNLFFPISVIAATTLSAAAIVLIGIGSTKQIALLRVLGVTRGKAIFALAFESLFVIALGVLFAIGVFVIFSSILFSDSMLVILLCIALYLSVCLCASFVVSVVITNKKPLELLQVKE